MMTENSKGTQWLIFLNDDPRANELVALALGSGPGDEDRLRRSVLCSDKKKRDFWIVTFRELRLIEKSARMNSFKVGTFVQEGSGTPRKWVDPAKARRKKALQAKVKKGA